MAVDFGFDPTQPEGWLCLMDMMARYHQRTGRPYKMPPGWLHGRTPEGKDGTG